MQSAQRRHPEGNGPSLRGGSRAGRAEAGPTRPHSHLGLEQRQKPVVRAVPSLSFLNVPTCSRETDGVEQGVARDVYSSKVAVTRQERQQVHLGEKIVF